MRDREVEREGGGVDSDFVGLRERERENET